MPHLERVKYRKKCGFEIYKVSILQQSRRLYDCWPLKRGLIAIVERQNHAYLISLRDFTVQGNALPCHSAAACFKPCILPELSNFYGLPGKAGGTPGWIRRIGSLVSSVLPVNRPELRSPEISRPRCSLSALAISHQPRCENIILNLGLTGSRSDLSEKVRLSCCL
jgi:hypothetical protein